MKKQTITMLTSLILLLLAVAMPAQEYVIRPVGLNYDEANANTPVNIVLRAGTPVELEIMNNIDGKYVKQGHTVDLRVKFDVVVNNRTVVAAGSVAKGLISQYKPRKGLGKAGMIEITPQYVQSVDGQFVPVSGTPITFEGKGRKGWAIGGIVLGVATGGIVTAATGFIKGKDAEVPGGTTLTCSIASTREVLVNTNY